jgi:hypothetical protein
MEILLRIIKDKNISFEIKRYSNGRCSSILYADDCGWVDQYRKKETVHSILVNEIKKVKAKIKEKKKHRPLSWVLLELKKARIKESQLTLF